MPEKIFVDSKNIKLYPTAYRGANADSKVFNPEARLFTEENAGRAFTALSTYKNGSFVIDKEVDISDSTKITRLRFAIHGYCFDLTNNPDAGSPYLSTTKYTVAVIQLQERNPIGSDTSNTKYPVYSLVNQSTPSSQYLDDLVTSPDYAFKGLALEYYDYEALVLALTDNTPAGNYYLCITKPDNGHAVIYEKSLIKYS